MTKNWRITVSSFSRSISYRFFIFNLKLSYHLACNKNLRVLKADNCFDIDIEDVNIFIEFLRVGRLFPMGKINIEVN